MSLLPLQLRCLRGRRPVGAAARWLVLLCLAAVPGVVLAKGPWLAPAEATQARSPVRNAGAALDEGRKIYLDRCADCHGRKGRGDGDGGSDLDPVPTNFTNRKVQEQTDGALFWKITEGRRPMPGYARKLSEEQRWQLVHYLRSFGPKTPGAPADGKSPVGPR